ncbi:MAG: mevalonate kinase [Archaeoglobales archaeon]|jgi:mevalonate kinase|nr:mevalonate kinase [Archaeoglobi archaeon]NHW23806.1 mevalonate kinase [Archaeoglobales archaeon]
MIASAPGKIILFGEHSVVYGRHALVSAINLRCRVEAKKSRVFRVVSPLGITGLDFKVHPYVSFAIKRFSELKRIDGAELIIKSEIPIASGLGSSAAVTVATLKALSGEFDFMLTDEEIFELAKKVELDVQGRASGIDPFISTFGGSWIFPERKKVEILFDFFVLKLWERSTKMMVEKVAKLREKHPEILERIFDAIDAIALKAPGCDSEDFEELIHINQSLLRAIGVSSPEIDELISKLEKDGFKVKLTGAGGGGCIFGIYRDRKPGGSFVVKPEMEGVRIEDS